MGKKSKFNPLNTRYAPAIAMSMAITLRFVKGSSRKIWAKISMKIVAV